MRLPTVTALIAAYNAEAFIGEAVDSALHQDYPAELLDVVVVDDGSTDSTSAIVEERAARHPGRVTLVHQPNAGNVAATNTAMAHVRGELVGLLDSDDAWPPDKIARHAAAMTPGVGLVYGDMTLIDAEGTVLEDSWMGLIAGGEPPSGRAFGRLLTLGTATSSAILVRADLLRAHLPIPADVPIPDWWISLTAAAAGEIAYVPEPRTLYRCHGANRSLGSDGLVLRDAFLRRLGVQRWFLRRLEHGQATVAEIAEAWEAFEHNASEALRLSGTPFAETIPVTPKDRLLARALAGVGRTALDGGDPASALVAFVRAAATDPWRTDARDGLHVALAAHPEGRDRPGQQPLAGARPFVILAFADELAEEPWLVDAFALAMRARDDVTLAIDASDLDPEAARAALERLAVPHAVDALAILGPLDELGRARLAAGVDAIYSQRPLPGAWRPTFSAARLVVLRDGEPDAA